MSKFDETWRMDFRYVITKKPSTWNVNEANFPQSDEIRGPLCSEWGFETIKQFSHQVECAFTQMSVAEIFPKFRYCCFIDSKRCYKGTDVFNKNLVCHFDDFSFV